MRNIGTDVYGDPINVIADGVMRNTGKLLFTATQWQELQRQTMIYKYIMASIPVPPQLLVSLSTQSNRVSMGLRFSNGSDLEPWRCRRTDGKKWRCTKDVVPDQKYCERHARKTKSCSRKPVETTRTKANQQTDECIMKNAGVPVYQSNNQFQQPLQSPIWGSKRDSWACLGSGSGSMPGGPLGEALCLGITSTQNEPSSVGYSL